MAEEKEVVTVMILYVDLKCSSCYKKVKKLLCKFPQIRDQVFDENKNKVTITVVCCNPEKLRDKLCCKGGKAIQSIEIVEKPPPKPPQKPKEVEKLTQPPPVVEKSKPKETEKPKEPEKSKPPPVVLVPTPKPDPPPKKTDPPAVKPPVTPKTQPQPDPMPPTVPQPQPHMPMPDPIPGYPHQPFCPPVSVCCQECYEGRGGGPCHYGYGRPVKPHVVPKPQPHQPFCPPVSVCCQECYQGRGGGPCHYGYGRPVPPPPGPCYYSNYGYQYNYRPCYVSRCDYFSEENPRGCSIM